MDEKIDKAIESVVLMIRPNAKPEDVLKFSQAALNLAHVKAQMESLVRKAKGVGS